MESQKFIIYSRKGMKANFCHSETAAGSACLTPTVVGGDDHLGQGKRLPCLRSQREGNGAQGEGTKVPRMWLMEVRPYVHCWEIFRVLDM